MFMAGLRSKTVDQGRCLWARLAPKEGEIFWIRNNYIQARYFLNNDNRGSRLPGNLAAAVRGHARSVMTARIAELTAKP